MNNLTYLNLLSTRLTGFYVIFMRVQHVDESMGFIIRIAQLINLSLTFVKYWTKKLITYGKVDTFIGPISRYCL